MRLLATLTLTFLLGSGANPLSKERSSVKPVSRADYELPKAIKPNAYDITIIPYFDNAPEEILKFRFKGTVIIEVEVFEETNLIRLHAYDMDINESDVFVYDVIEPNVALPIVSVVRSSDDKHFLDITLGSLQLVGVKMNVVINYLGRLNLELDGFYRSSYVNYLGETKWLGVTQFSPTGARRAFPCFDEPSHKAKFTFHIAREPLKDVTSNMPVVAANRPVEGHNGWVWVDFQQSILMPTFVVAFTVHDFGSITSSKDDRFRILARREFIDTSTSYALEIAPTILGFMEYFTNFTYDSSMKLDQTAIPDFGPYAMENWGLINYREVALLNDAFYSTAADKQKTVTVMSHEIAHFWFGNLVTPEWWNEVWLKEGFATYFEYIAAGVVEPSFQLEQAFIKEELQPVFETDAAESSKPLTGNVDSPASILSGFGNIPYNKGGSILRFVNGFLGSENFKVGIQAYIDANNYGSVTKDSVWASLSPFVPEGLLPSGVTLRDVMNTWTDQPGYPLITVTRNYDNNEINFQQQRFFTVKKEIESPEKWFIPISMIKESENGNWQDLSTKGWLTPAGEFNLSENLPANNEWIVLNPRQTGYYRVNYDQKNWDLIIATLNHTEKWLIILDINRAQIIDDSMALAFGNYLPYETALSTTEYLNRETEYLPWSTALKAFNSLRERLVDESPDRLIYFRTYVLNKMTPLYDTLNGFQVNETDGHVVMRKRNLILLWACNFGHDSCNKDAAALFQEWKIRPSPDFQNPIHPDLRSVVYCHGMANEADYDFLITRYTKAQSAPSESNTILSALGCAPTPELLEKLLNETVKVEGSMIRSQDTRNVFSAVISNPEGVDVALNFLVTQYDVIKVTYQAFGSAAGLFSLISVKLNTVEQRAKLEQFLVDYPDEPEIVKTVVESGIAIIDANIQWLTENKETVLKFFEDRVKGGAVIFFLSPIVLIFAGIFTRLM
ncbi:aminopeptidase Ey-like [Neocloeon triangulifer]|uniref:aminopeptidase Ey-like n=1 Tax=Neocloeon triangulifer TaxID=2078957 RepID=UPI00286F8005|nr:aminopeptidase Ey-like [Neocloeon triangulifer]